MAICRCDWSEDECKETDSGGGYSGDLAHSASGRHCYIWNDLDSYVTNHLWKSHDHRMISVKVSLCTKDKVDWLNVEIRTGPLVLEVKWINWIWKNRQWKSHDLEVMADALPSLKNYCHNPDNNPWNITDWFFLVQSKYLCTCDCILRRPATAAIQTTIVVVRGVSPTTSLIRWNTATSLVVVRVSPLTNFTRQTVFPRCSVHAKFSCPLTASTRYSQWCCSVMELSSIFLVFKSIFQEYCHMAYPVFVRYSSSACLSVPPSSSKCCVMLRRNFWLISVKRSLRSSY